MEGMAETMLSFGVNGGERGREFFLIFIGIDTEKKIDEAIDESTFGARDDGFGQKD